MFYATFVHISKEKLLRVDLHLLEKMFHLGNTELQKRVENGTTWA